MRFAAVSGLALVLLSLAVSGCATRHRPPPAAIGAKTTDAKPLAVVDDQPDPLPRVVRRLVREQKSELDEMMMLVGVVGDTRGRARALDETRRLAEELAEIERGLERVDSDGLDERMSRLHVLESKIEVLHDALRIANPDPGAPQGSE